MLSWNGYPKHWTPLPIWKDYSDPRRGSLDLKKSWPLSGVVIEDPPWAILSVRPSVCLIRSSIHVEPFPKKVRAGSQLARQWLARARMLLREGARAAGGLDWLRRSFLRRVAGASAVPEVGARVASLNGNADPEVGARVASPNGNTDAEVGARVASLNGSSDQDPLWTPLWQR